MIEADIEMLFRWHVERLGGKTWKFESPGRRGASDRIACLPNGETWFVELKHPTTGRVSRHQHEFAGDMLRLKQRYARLHTVAKVEGWADAAAARLSN